jgi:hypothetical protein
MPYGSLTPLGHRLRQVLVSLRPNAIHLDNSPPHRASYTTNALTSTPNQRLARTRVVSTTPTSRCAQHEAVAPAPDDLEALLWDNSLPSGPIPSTPLRPISRRHENRRTKVDYLGNELRVIGKSDIAPRRLLTRRRENHFNHRSQHGKRLHADNEKRHASDNIPSLKRAKTLSINRILASYIQYAAQESVEVRAEWMASVGFVLSPDETRFLAHSNYGITDLDAWATMVTESDSFKAANILHARVASHGTRSVPLPILSYILQRPYITANALRILMQHAWSLLADLSASADQALSPDAVFVVFTRLTRHAREVWPSALPSIANCLVQFLPDVRPNRDGDLAPAAQAVTFILNKAMMLLSEPTAVAPFKDVNHQEKAIVCILSAMAENEPPLQIDREGYRAVIRLQLASGKTHSEQQWAALKALSWPPWKEDRTDMDSEIGPEHGISRARATLQKMKEAGYGPQSWEKTAGVYTGWDVDGTPTIQTRVVLPIWKDEEQTQRGRIVQHRNASLWVARIKTTRTVQEAWACYLAYEDAKHPADQSVLLAILEKLHKEDSRFRNMATSHAKNRQHDASLRQLFPGDTKELEPLPPSTHLYTYTRTSPPSAHDFYLQLQDHNVDLQDHCLAYLICNATSFRGGVGYLKAAMSRYPVISALFTSVPSFNINDVPAVLFHAYIEFLSRYSNVDTAKIFTKRTSQTLDNSSASLAQTLFNFQHSLIQAIWLLKEWRTRHLPAWNAVLDALSRTESYKTMHLTERPATTATNATESPNLDANTIIAYRLTQQVLRLLQERNMAPDTYSFLALCRSTENVGVACWGILAHDYKSKRTATKTHNASNNSTSDLVQEVKELLSQQRPYGRVEQYFKLLVGEHSFADLDDPIPPNDPTTSNLPRLLAIPSPALLHAYIRALGWHGSHVRVLRTLKWMVKHAPELTEDAERSRNGPLLMRRTLIAVRVFLERSWLAANSILDYDFTTQDAFSRAELDDKPQVLRRLEAPAYEVQIDEARALVERLEGWGGWATDEEVEGYCRDRRFRDIR